MLTLSFDSLYLDVFFSIKVIFETVHYLNELKYVDLYALAGNHRGHPFLPWRRKTDSDDGNAGDNIGKAVTMVDAMSESESELDHQLGDSVALN